MLINSRPKLTNLQAHKLKTSQTKYMTTLLLVRHGETVGNANQILQGQTPGELNESGVAQAEKLARELSDTPIDAFVSSDLQRAEHTCRIIAAPHNMPFTSTPLLRERDWGGFTGAFIPSLKDKVWPEDVESLTDIKRRARLFLDMIAQHYPNQTVLAVGHGIINKAIQSVFYDKEMHEVEKMGNAEVRVLKVKG